MVHFVFLHISFSGHPADAVEIPWNGSPFSTDLPADDWQVKEISGNIISYSGNYR